MNDEKDIDINAAAEALLASAGSDQLRRFQERFGNRPDEAVLPDDPPPEIGENAQLPPQDTIRPIIPDMVRKLTEIVREYLSDDELTSLSRQFEAFLDSDAFKARIARQRETEPFSRLTERILAFDENLRKLHLEFDLPFSDDDLQKALTCNAKTKHVVPLKDLPKLHDQFEFSWTMPLLSPRLKMLKTLLEWVADSAAFARHYGSDSLRSWREAYRLAFRTAGGPKATQDDIAAPFPDTTARRVTEILREAQETLFSDCMICQRHMEIWGTK